MLRCLEINEMKSVYRTLIKKDFPRNERRPFFSIRKLHGEGRYLCLVLEEENQIVAYAAFIFDKAINSVLLDYFAVDKNQRGSGIGSRFISSVREYWIGKSGIILECENPGSAKDEDEKAIRKRRIDFYLRGGAETTAVHWRMFGVSYDILWMQTDPVSGIVDIANDLTRLYSLSFPSIIRKLFTRVTESNS